MLLPPTFGMLESLQLLILYNNSLEGLLPRDLIHLKNLTNVNLSNKKFNGSIIPLCGSSFLVKLDLANNSFSRKIPSKLGDSRGLRRLRLGRNGLNGNIPKEIGQMLDLNLLDLSWNNLSGVLPAELSKCTQLAHLAHQ